MDSYVPCAEIVARLGIAPGGLLLVGSDVLQLALNAREVGDRFDPNAFIDDLLAAVGPTGTVLFPTFNFDFCQGKTYDVLKSSTTIGALPRTGGKRNEFRRTQHRLHLVFFLRDLI